MDKQEEEEGTILIEEEVVVVDLIASHYIHNLIATMATILDPSLTTIISHHNISYRIKRSIYSSSVPHLCQNGTFGH